MKKMLVASVITALCLSTGCMSDRGMTAEQYQALNTKIDNLTETVNQNRAVNSNSGTDSALAEAAEKLHQDHQALLKRIKDLNDTNEKLVAQMNKDNTDGSTNAAAKDGKGKTSGEQEKDVVYNAKDTVTATADDKVIVGAAEWVVLDDFKIAINGRIDTGAATTSINAVNIEEFERDGKKWVRFDLPDSQGNPHKIEAKFVGYETIVQSSMQDASAKSTRPYINIKISIGNISKYAILNLTNRSHMTYPVLVGREFLKDYAVVDVGRKYIYKKPKADVYIDINKKYERVDNDYSKVKK